MKTPLLTKNHTADAAIGAHRIVKAGSADRYVATATAATDALMGVSEYGCTAAGDGVDIIQSGIAEVYYGGTVTRGAPLTADGDGAAVAAGEGDRVIGYAVIAGVAGDIGEVLVIPGNGVSSFRAEITLTAAQVKALNAAPIALVAAPGAGKAIVPTLAVFFRSCLAKIQTHFARVVLSMAMRMTFSAVPVRVSKSLLKRRNEPNQANVRSTIQRFGRTAKPSTIRSEMCSTKPSFSLTNRTAVPR
ncbi:hypothetical protein MishRS11D_07660 [Methylomagnum ishizawai]|nr:hypothetical protein MishRS11D_07660 [Methylomagnum ishizawai]